MCFFISGALLTLLYASVFTLLQQCCRSQFIVAVVLGQLDLYIVYVGL